MNIAGRIAKYLATSLAIENVVRQPRVISSCLPTSTTSSSLVGLESRSTMLPASRAAWVPVFMAIATSAWASAGASLVPSPVMATSLPFGLLVADELQLHLRRGLGQEVVDAGLGGDGGRGQRVVAGDHDGAQAHRPEPREALLDAALHDVLEVDDPEDARARRRRRAACRPTWRSVPPPARPPAASRRRASATCRAIASTAPLRIDAPVRGRSRSCASAPRTARTSPRAAPSSRPRRP